VRRALAVLAVVAACVVGALAVGAGGGNGARTYEIVLDNAFGVTKGGDFKIAGVKAGKTEGMHIEGQAHPVAVVEAKVTQSGQADLRADARCEVRPQSFIGE
jgi:ABC-type transporter Mla subunit MlaD